MKTTPSFNRGVTAGALLIIGADAVHWFIDPISSTSSNGFDDVGRRRTQTARALEIASPRFRPVIVLSCWRGTPCIVAANQPQTAPRLSSSRAFAATARTTRPDRQERQS